VLGAAAKDTFRSIVGTLLDGHHAQGVDAHHGHPKSVEAVDDGERPKSVG
jgi:hypothetical protein